jgi:hypothetical protein
MTRLIFDYDPILYECGFIGEKRHVKVVHRASGDDYEFPNRTAFWGHHLKRAGGWLAQYNEGRTSPRLPDEFDCIDVQVPESITVPINTIKSTIQGLKEVCNADQGYYGYSGKGDSFRLGLSTVLKYKGNRDSALRPLLLDDLKDYLMKHHACKLVSGIEADDACSIDQFDGYQKWKQSKSDMDKLILAYVDKDYLQCTGHLYNTNKQDGICTHEGFGWLELVERVSTSGKKVEEVKGRGRMWLYQQVMDGDSSDNYCANSASDMKWGAKSAYALLKDAKNDKQAFEALVKGYKLLYPAPKTIVGWRGYEDGDRKKKLLPNASEFEIKIDWLYMMQENFTMAFMLRRLGDKIDVRSTLDKLGINYKETTE